MPADLTGSEASELARIEALLDTEPGTSGEVYKSTISFDERAIAVVAAHRAGTYGGGGGSQPFKLVGPIPVEYSDIPDDLDQFVLYTPTGGEQILMWYVDIETVVDWDTGANAILAIGLTPLDYNTNQYLESDVASSGLIASDWGSRPLVINTNHYDPTFPPFTNPFAIQMNNPDDDTPTQGHIDFFFVVATPVAP